MWSRVMLPARQQTDREAGQQFAHVHHATADIITRQLIAPSATRQFKRCLRPMAVELEHQAWHYGDGRVMTREGDDMLGPHTTGRKRLILPLRAEELRSLATQGQGLVDHPELR